MIDYGGRELVEAAMQHQARGGDKHDAVNAVELPFAGGLETPPACNRMARHHGHHVDEATVKLRRVLLDLATDVAIALWALPVAMRVTDDDLLLHGYDPRDFPVHDDDW
jgi:hypothetical protein